MQNLGAAVLILAMAGSVIAAEPSTPAVTQGRQPQAKQPKEKPSARSALPFEDPLAREKLEKDLWITKGVQGGLKTRDLWILQPPNPASTSNDDGDPSTATSALGSWPGNKTSPSANKSDNLTAEERARLIKEWERFVFGEPKEDPNRKNPSDDLWRQPTDRPDATSNPATDDAFKYPVKKAEPSISLNLPGASPMPDPFQPKQDIPRNDPRFSPFGSSDVPGLRPESWDPAGTRNSQFSLPGMIPQNSVGLPGANTPGTIAPNLLPSAPVGPNLSFGQPPNNLNMPGAPQGPVPSPRAHSTDSFAPRQW